MSTTQLITLTLSLDIARVNLTPKVDQRPDDAGDVDGRAVMTIFAELTVVTVISVCIIVSNVVNLAVLASLGTSMPWATRFFLINLSVSDLLVGVIACAPAIVPAATGRWIYGGMWCQVSGLTHGTSVTISIWSISMVGLHRYAATTLPLRYRKLVARSWHYYVIVAGLWVAALLTFAAPLLTKPDLIYYRYSDSQKMCGLHWEYPAFAIITGLYIPILSGVVLIFTACRISSTLRRRSPLSSQPAAGDTVTVAAAAAAADGKDTSGFWFCHRLKFFSTSPAASEVSVDIRDDDLPLDELATNLGSVGGGGGNSQSPLPQRQQQSSGVLAASCDNNARHRWTRGNRRTLRILMFTGIAYFMCWGPYVGIVFAKSFLPSLRPPSALEFMFMWLANANSGVNVFIYSSTNVAFRRQCLRFAGRLLVCCCCGCGFGRRQPRMTHGRVTSKRSSSLAGDCDSVKCRPFPSVAPDAATVRGRLTRHAPAVLQQKETSPRSKGGHDLPTKNVMLTVPTKFVFDSTSV